MLRKRGTKEEKKEKEKEKKEGVFGCREEGILRKGDDPFEGARGDLGGELTEEGGEGTGPGKKQSQVSFLTFGSSTFMSVLRFHLRSGHLRSDLCLETHSGNCFDPLLHMNSLMDT